MHSVTNFWVHTMLFCHFGLNRKMWTTSIRLCYSLSFLKENRIKQYFFPFSLFHQASMHDTCVLWVGWLMKSYAIKPSTVTIRSYSGSISHFLFDFRDASRLSPGHDTDSETSLLAAIQSEELTSLILKSDKFVFAHMIVWGWSRLTIALCTSFFSRNVQERYILIQFVSCSQQYVSQRWYVIETAAVMNGWWEIIYAKLLYFSKQMWCNQS